jgi:Antitoxin VbhA
MRFMADRAQIVSSVDGSFALEGLEVTPEVAELAAAWARGDATDEDLRVARRELVARHAATSEPAPAA